MYHGNMPGTGYAMPDFEELYPEAYHAVYPLVQEMAERLRGTDIDPQTLDRIVRQIMRDSGLAESAGDPGAMRERDDMPGRDPEPDIIMPAARMNYGHPVYSPPRVPSPPEPAGHHRPPMPPRRPRPPRPPMPPRPPQIGPAELIRILLLRELAGR